MPKPRGTLKKKKINISQAVILQILLSESQKWEKLYKFKSKILLDRRYYFIGNEQIVKRVKAVAFVSYLFIRRCIDFKQNPTE